MITLNDNINDNTHPAQEKMITPNDNINDNTLKGAPWKMIISSTLENDTIQAFKNENIYYTMKNDNILYTRKL